MNYDDIEFYGIDVLQCLDIPDDIVSPIESLVKLGYMFRGVFMEAVYGKPLSEILVEHREFLLLADKFLNDWIDTLDLEFDQ